MTNLANYFGSYNLNGDYLIHTEKPIKLLISFRAKTTTKKPNKFLVDKTTNVGRYISSLYHVSSSTSNVYSFDYQANRYVLSIDYETNRAEIINPFEKVID